MENIKLGKIFEIPENIHILIKNFQKDLQDEIICIINSNNTKNPVKAYDPIGGGFTYIFYEKNEIIYLQVQEYYTKKNFTASFSKNIKKNTNNYVLEIDPKEFSKILNYFENEKELTYLLTPTSLGLVIKVSKDNKIIDFSDYDSW